MESLALILILAFFAGLAFRQFNYPPLLGYLIIGFVCAGFGLGSWEQLAPIADIGVTLLLFTIGLKLKPEVLLKPYILAPAVLHMVLVIPLTAAVIMLAGLFFPPLHFNDATPIWTLALALSFSSTVFAIKIFDERGEALSFHAAITIGILVIQDIIAVAFLVLTSDKLPSVWTLAVIPLAVAYKLWVPWLKKLMSIIGHGELLLLFGITAALSAHAVFELLHLKGGLGALIAGAVLGFANAERSSELNKSLLNIKNLLLIGFFLQIGYAGTPTLQMLLIAAALLVILGLRPIIYFSLLTLFRLRARTATLAGAALSTYSEFGLIVTAIAAAEGWVSNEWLIIIAIAISLSFFIATPVNSKIQQWYRTHGSRLESYQKERLPEEEIERISDAKVVILGMGRVGKGAYQHMKQVYGDVIVGVEESFERTQVLKEEGFRCVHGDASDRDFWEQAGVTECDTLLVSLSNHREHLSVVQIAREYGFNGKIAVTSGFEDERNQLEALGCVSFNLYSDVGRGFAEAAIEKSV